MGTKYLLRMALRNLTRNTRRSFLSALSLVIALAMIVFAQGFIRGMLDKTEDNTARYKTGHVRIAAEEYLRQERLLPLSEAVATGPALDEVIGALPGVAARTDRIRFGVLLDHDDNNVPAMGLAADPEMERDVFRLQDAIVEGKYLTGADDEVIVGAGLADKLGIGVGDTLVLITQTAYGSPTGANLVVRGTVRTGAGQIDATNFFMTLAGAQNLLDMDGRVSEVILMLDDRDQAKSASAALQRRLDESGFTGIRALAIDSDVMISFFGMAEAIYFFIYLIILAVASTAIINTMMMVVFERTREIGMMKALGMTNRSVIGVLVLESAFIGLAGSVAGVVLGAALVLGLSGGGGIDFSGALGGEANPTLMSGVVHPELTATALVTGFLLGLVLSFAVGLVATRRVSKMNPAEALRTI
jgi:putative ABC transport system permease protein